MSYGLDYSEVRYETDHVGNRLKATIPYTMFSALTEFWIAARRAQTAKVEATSRPGQFKGSLQAAQLATKDETIAARPPDCPTPLNPHDRHWQNLIARLPEFPPEAQPAAIEASPPPASPPDPIPVSVAAKKPSRVFYREFVEAPPAEVMERIASGVYFTRAWREYRGLTLGDVAELSGRDKTTIVWHESGKSVPKLPTLDRLAQVYDCPVAQMTPKPGSDTSPFEGMPEVEPAKAHKPVPGEVKAHRTISEPRSPADTDYPEGVLAHLLAGKSPMLAWRLYRGMNVKALAEAYGTTGSNVKAMEANGWLRPKTIDKLCPIFHCKPEQLLRPDGMASTRDAIQDTALAMPAPAVVINGNAEAKRKAMDPAPKSAMEAAFLQAGVTDGRSHRDPNEKDRARDGRLARMQAEMARL
jgi:transcriptional regulator with XRE-family HTH domain